MTAVATEDDAAVGRRLRELRERASKSQAEVSEELGRLGATGFYPQTIAKLEAGSRSLRFHEASKLVTALDATLGELLDVGPVDAKRGAVRATARDVRRRFDVATLAAFELEVSGESLRQAIDELATDVEPSELSAFRDTLHNCTARRAAIAAQNAVNDPELRAESTSDAPDAAHRR